MLLATADFALAAEILFCAVLSPNTDFTQNAEVRSRAVFSTDIGFEFCTKAILNAALLADASFATDVDLVADTEDAPAAILLAVDAGFLVSGDFFTGTLFVAAFFLAETFLESDVSFLTFALETLAVRFLRDAALALELSPSALAYFFVRSSVNLSVRENERTTARAPIFAHFKAANFDNSQTPSVKILRAANFKATPTPSFSAKGVAHTSPPAPIFAARPQRR